MKRSVKVIIFLVLTFLFLKLAFAEESVQFPFKLMATLVDSDTDRSGCVLMELETKKQANYRTLDKVAGYQIVKITRGSIKLLKDGKLYALDFPLGNDNVPSYDASITIERQAVLKKVANAGFLLTEAKPMPIVEAGKIQGFKIPALKDKSLLKMSGLAEGDIATKINGEKLDSIPKALQLYNKYKNQEQINLEIKRGDVVMNLNYFIH